MLEMQFARSVLRGCGGGGGIPKCGVSGARPWRDGFWGVIASGQGNRTLSDAAARGGHATCFGHGGGHVCWAMACSAGCALRFMLAGLSTLPPMLALDTF